MGDASVYNKLARSDSPFMPIKKKGMAKIKFLEDAFYEGRTFPQHYIHTPE